MPDSESLKLCVDTPAVHDGRAVVPVGSALVVEGWALAAAGVATIDVALDGKLVGSARYGMPRPDVAVAHPEWPDAQNCGFQLVAPIGHLPTRRQAARITLRDKAGNAKQLDFSIETSNQTKENPKNPRRSIDLSCWRSNIVLAETTGGISLDRPIGIFVHIFYETLADEIADYLARIDLPKKIYVSTGSEEKRSKILQSFERFNLASLSKIVIVPNYGHDIAPLSIAFAGKFAEHDICLKIHGKASFHSSTEFGEGWRSHLFEELIGDSQRVHAIVATMLADPNLGLLMPQHYYRVMHNINIGPNYEPMQRILRKIGVDLATDQNIQYPSGSMFWFRGEALAGLQRLGFDWFDFDPAANKKDGTLAHGMERCFLFLCAHERKRWGLLPPKPTGPKIPRDAAIVLIRRSGAFDEAYYRATYPDVGESGADSIEHWVDVGWREDRKPSDPRYPNPVAYSLLEQHVRGFSLARPWKVQRPRIQVHRPGALGDVLLITPVLRALRTKHPNAEIIVSTAFPEILENNPFLDGILRSDAPLAGFDQTIVLQYETRQPEEHIVDAYCRDAGVSVMDGTPEIYLTYAERFRAAAFLRMEGIEPYEPFCVMQMNGGWSVKDWPSDRFKDVAEKLERRGLKSVLLGKDAKIPADFAVDLRGRTDVRLAAAIIEKCALLVTVDSGLMHFGYAFRCPVVALFGCTDPAKIVPDWGLRSTLYGEVICRGCVHRQPPAMPRLAPPCPWETVRCMEAISTESVIATAEAELARAANPVVSVVIPHYLHFPLLDRCLSSIFRHGAQVSFEVIVVANGSPEDNLRRLQAWRPRVRIVVLTVNQGFSRACNIGAQQARGEYVLFLNDDIEATPRWLDELVAFIGSDPKLGIVGPKLLYPDSHLIQSCGSVVNEQGLLEHIYRGFPGDFAAANRPRYYRAITGACLMIERQSFADFGGFEASYHGTGGCEDTDLCFSVLDHGKIVGYCPTSVLYHHEGFTRGRREPDHPEEANNRAILQRRWAKYLTPDISDYRLLAEIEAEERTTWKWLREVPSEVVARHLRDDRSTSKCLPFAARLALAS